MKRIALLLALVLLLSAVSMPSMAEVVNDYLPDELPGEVVGETGAEGLFGEGEDGWKEPEGDASAVMPAEAEPEIEEAEADAAPAEAPEEAFVEPEDDDSEDAEADSEADWDFDDDGAVTVAFAKAVDSKDGPGISVSSVTLGAGETFQISASTSEELLTWSSDREDVAQVSPTGLVTAMQPGEATITCAFPGGLSRTCAVRVKRAPDAVAFSREALTLGVGERCEDLTVAVGSVPGEFASALTFATSKKRAVLIDENGAVTAKKKGKAIVRVSTYNGLEAFCAVQVLKAPRKVTLTADHTVLGVGETGTLTATLPRKTAGRVQFRSERPEIVSVDAATGQMQAMAEGVCRVWVRTFNGKENSIEITVMAAPQSLAFPAADVVMGVGMKTDALASVNAGAGGAIAYSVSDPAVADVENGLLVARSIGETKVVATTYNGLTAAANLVVRPAPKHVTLPYKKLEIGLNEVVRLQPDVGDSASTFTYKTSSKRRVSVTPDGVIRGLKKGSATITITTYNKKKFKLKVKVLKTPTAVAVSPSSAELGVGETLALTSSLMGQPGLENRFASRNPSVASVDAVTGVVTAISPGRADIVLTAYNGSEAVCEVTVYGKPSWVKADAENLSLFTGESYALEVTMSPNSRSPLAFVSADPSVATVSPEGEITGVGKGETTIAIGTNVPGVSAKVNVKVSVSPTSISLKKTTKTLAVGGTYQLEPEVGEDVTASFTYESSDTEVATVAPDGVVVALGRGMADITVSTQNGLSATLILTVVDPTYPEQAELTNAPERMKTGDSVQLTWTVTPATADPDFMWASSDEDVVTVTDDGLVKAVGYGFAVIAAQSTRNEELLLEFQVAVESDDVVLTLPAWTTNVAGIKANLKMIDAIRVCAIGKINELRSKGVITESDANKRKSIVNNAFADLAFPWVTPEYQLYWKAENSEDGAKDFKPDRVYFGMPYISGSGSNRQYNAAKAVSESRFVNSGLGYYVLNQAKLLKGKYVGNDCSCFVDAAIWGTNSSHSADRTVEIAQSTAYKTIKNPESLRPGDLICKGYAHVIMFLYYANPEKTQIMLIQNGGSEPGTNTVHCTIAYLEDYLSHGYAIRRLKSLG